MSDERSRPLGVTLMGILTLLSAVLWLIIGAGLIMLLGATLIQVQPIPDLQPMPESDAAMGPVLFLWGVFNSEVAFGLFNMERRAWVLAVMSTLTGLAFSALGISIFATTIQSSPYAYQLKGILIAIGMLQLLYLLISHGNFKKD
ncbi:MAG: hypothetical protein ACFFBS_01830 [Promethearchaeota archaeon]